MNSAKFIIGSLAIALSFISTNIAKASGLQPSSVDSKTIAIEVSGGISGYTNTQLTAYLTREMQKTAKSPWHFIAGEPGSLYPNRIQWSFKTLHTVWKGASHMGLGTPAFSESYLQSEAKLYLRDEYQITMVTHPTSDNKKIEQAISEMVGNVNYAFFIENKPGDP